VLCSPFYCCANSPGNAPCTSTHQLPRFVEPHPATDHIAQGSNSLRNAAVPSSTPNPEMATPIPVGPGRIKSLPKRWRLQSIEVCRKGREETSKSRWKGGPWQPAGLSAEVARRATCRQARDPSRGWCVEKGCAETVTTLVLRQGRVTQYDGRNLNVAFGSEMRKFRK
jgi:hypothetical protein